MVKFFDCTECGKNKISVLDSDVYCKKCRYLTDRNDKIKNIFIYVLFIIISVSLIIYIF